MGNDMKMSITTLVFVALLIQVPNDVLAERRGGVLADIHLGGASANFDLEGGNDDGDTGATFAFDLGYAWRSGFALTGGVSATAFVYEIQASDGGSLADLSFTFSILEISGWYFHPISPRWEIYGRVGLGPSTGTTELEFGSTKISSDESGTGFVVSGGANMFFSEEGTFALSAELFHRRYGLTFNEGELAGEEIAATGLALVARWR